MTALDGLRAALRTQGYAPVAGLVETYERAGHRVTVGQEGREVWATVRDGEVLRQVRATSVGALLSRLPHP